MIRRLIKTIRSQPKAIRDKIAFGVAGGFTAIIFVIWIYNLPDRMEALSDRQKSEDSPPVFSQLFDEIKDQFSSNAEDLPTEELPDEVQVDEDWQKTLPNSGNENSNPTMNTEEHSIDTISEFGFSSDDGTEAESPEPAKSIRVVTVSSEATSSSPEVE